MTIFRRALLKCRSQRSRNFHPPTFSSPLSISPARYSRHVGDSASPDGSAAGRSSHLHRPASPMDHRKRVTAAAVSLPSDVIPRDVICDVTRPAAWRHDRDRVGLEPGGAAVDGSTKRLAKRRGWDDRSVRIPPGGGQVDAGRGTAGVRPCGIGGGVSPAPARSCAAGAEGGTATEHAAPSLVSERRSPTAVQHTNPGYPRKRAP